MVERSLPLSLSLSDCFSNFPAPSAFCPSCNLPIGGILDLVGSRGYSPPGSVVVETSPLREERTETGQFFHSLGNPTTDTNVTSRRSPLTLADCERYSVGLLFQHW